MTSIGDTWSGRQLLITRRLKQRRADLGLTQKQVVTRLARCGVRTTNRALSSLEHGAGIDVAKLPALATALDCTVTYLVGLTDDPHRWMPDEVPRAASSAAFARDPTDHRAALRPPASLIIATGVPDHRHFGLGGESE